MMLSRGSYCQVFVNRKQGPLSDLGWDRPAWIEGIVVSRNAKRTTVDVGRKVISKRNRFIRNIQ